MSRSSPTGSRQEMNWPGRKTSGAGRRRKNARVSAPWSTTRSSRAASSGAAMGGDLIDGVARDHDHDLRLGVLDHGLAAEARGGREPGRLVEEVVLLLFGGRELLEALLHDDVASGAGAVPSAGVLERHAVGEEHVEDRSRPPVVLKRRLSRVELDHALGLTGLEEDADPCHPAAKLAS